jgi:cytochrome c oxidase assembly protein subunit 15
LNPRYQPWLHRYAVALAVCTLFLVVAGASVTSKEAGLSVPDWPLSYGQVIPEMTGGVLFETGHRLIAASVGLMTVVLAVWLWRAARRVWMRRLGWIAVAAVLAQGLLGGITVLWLQPPWVSTAHACLAQMFFATTAAIALYTSRGWLEGAETVTDHGWPSLRSLAWTVPGVVVAQIALGAGFRHRAIGLMPHVLGALVTAGALLVLAAFVLHQFPRHRALGPAARALLGIACLQVALGLAAYYARLRAAEAPLAMVLITVAHVAAGGLTLASATVVSIQILRNVRTRAAAEPAAMVTS